MLIEMHGGMLTLTTFCIFAMVATKLYQKIRGKNEGPGVLRILDDFFEKLARYAEPTAFLASIGGVIGLVVSSIVGYYAWPVKVIMTSPLALNKIMIAIFSTEFWLVFLLIRARYGENLWKNGRLATIYVCSGFAGFFFMVLTGSLGGHMAGKGSVLDPVYELLGINTDIPWIVGLDLVPFLAIAVSALIVILFILYAYLR
jgi:hypothetical protein